MLVRLPACLPPPNQQLLVKDVGTRMRLLDVAAHPWIQALADPAVLSQNGSGSDSRGGAAGAGAGASDAGAARA
jgi:hypothetical protein